ncbi:MAG TPA: hypothetical protein VMO88_08405 [Acidimicrobiales bacterium]|nr:hypothetical protein [Acidimicrobiales bacterium]
MATLRVDGDELVLDLSWREKVAGFHGSLRSPLSWVRSVRVVSDPWLVMRGWRMAGFAIPRAFAFGTRRHGDGYDFTVVRSGRPAVNVELSEGRFQWLMVSAGDSEEAAAQAAEVAAAAGIRVSESG